MMAVTGGRAAREFARMAPLEVLRLPFASLRLVTAMLWRRRLAGAPLDARRRAPRHPQGVPGCRAGMGRRGRRIGLGGAGCPCSWQGGADAAYTTEIDHEQHHEPRQPRPGRLADRCRPDWRRIRREGNGETFAFRANPPDATTFSLQAQASPAARPIPSRSVQLGMGGTAPATGSQGTPEPFNLFAGHPGAAGVQASHHAPRQG